LKEIRELRSSSSQSTSSNLALVGFCVFILLAEFGVYYGNFGGAAVNKTQTLVLAQQQQTDSPIKEFPVPTPNSGPLAIVSTANQTFWFTEYNAGRIGEFFAINGSFHEFPVPENGARPAALAVDAQGRVWFSDQSASGTIWMFNPSNSAFTSHKINTPNSIPLFILIDKQSNVWFTEELGNKLGELSYPTYTTMTEFPLPTANSQPVEMAAQQNTSIIWVTETHANKIAKFDTTSRSFQEFDPSVSLKSPVGIVVDSSGNVWVSEHGGSSIVEFQPSTSTFRKYITSVPPISPYYSAPATLAIDKSGHLWFVEHFSNKVGRLNPNSSSIDEFAIPKPGAFSVLNALDPSGNFWFTELLANEIGVVLQNSTSPLSVTVKLLQSTQLNAGQTTTTSVFIANKVQSPVQVTLNTSSSFSSNGQTTKSEVSLSSSVLNLNLGQNATVTVSITPDGSLSSGLYSVGIVATDGNTSSVGIVFMQVQGSFNFLNTIASNIQEIGLALIVVLGGVYLFVRRRTRIASGKNLATSVAASVTGIGVFVISSAILSLVIVSTIHPTIIVHAKCTGIPVQGPNGQPDYFGIALDVAFFALPAYFLYVIIKDMLKNKKRKVNKDEK
jgi:virginiamycin B lyase